MRCTIYLFVFICFGISACALTLPVEQVTQINLECSGEAACIAEKTDAAIATLIEDRKFARETRHAIDLENWRLCETVLYYNGIFTVHYGHSHGRRTRIRPWDIKSDLADNNCRRILRSYWVRYE